VWRCGTDPSATYKDLDEKMEEAGVSSILVVQEGKLMGVVTRRDVALIDDPNEPVSKVGTTTGGTRHAAHDTISVVLNTSDGWVGGLDHDAAQGVNCGSPRHRLRGGPGHRPSKQVYLSIFLYIGACRGSEGLLVDGDGDDGDDDHMSFFDRGRIKILPLVDEENRLKGLVTSKDILNQMRRPFASLDKRGQLLVGAAVGVKEGFLQRAERLIKSGANALVIDIAHGHRFLFLQLPPLQCIISKLLFCLFVWRCSDLAIDALVALKKHFPTMDVIAGNVATAEVRLHTDQYSNFLHSCSFLSPPPLVHPGDA
jgi:CBS domain-containing protein